jgi:hypothetical protein
MMRLLQTVSVFAVGENDQFTWLCYVNADFTGCEFMSWPLCTIPLVDFTGPSPSSQDVSFCPFVGRLHSSNRQCP